MQGRTTRTSTIWRSAAFAFGGAMLFAVATGCVEVKAPERIVVNRHEPVDASQVPPTASHEEARQRLAEAYAEIRYLQRKVSDLEEDKAELRRELKRHDD